MANSNYLYPTANSTGFGGGPRLSLVSTSIPDSNFPKSIRNETTNNRTVKRN